MTESVETVRKYPYLRLEGIPGRFIAKRMDGLVGYDEEIKKAKEAIQAGRSVFITGGCGSGKTHMACALLRMAHYLGSQVSYDVPVGEYRPIPDMTYLFVPAVEYFLDIKASFGSDSEDERRIIKWYSDQTCLLIDDVGAEKITDWSRQAFYLLIDRRYRECKQTIITSNLGLNELAQQIDDRIASRILEMGIVIKLDGKDYRLTTHTIGDAI